MLATNAMRPQASIATESTRLGLAESIAIYNWAKFEIALTATRVREGKRGNGASTGNFDEM
jgi:hypothetical protein